MIPLRLLPYAVGGLSVIAAIFAAYQWGRASAERDDRERTIEAIQMTWAAQVQTLDARYAYDAARAAQIDQRLASIERLAAQPSEPIYVTPLPPECPVPIVRVSRLRDLANAGNAALAGPVPSAAASDGPATTDPGPSE